MLKIRDISKRFGADIQAVDQVSLAVERGEVVALLGPSGCGKTTLLRIIAGLEEADAGTVELDGKDLRTIPIHRRNFGFMFQDFALFPHRTVGENIAFGLRMRNDSAPAIHRRVAEMLELVNLPNYGERSIFELSGGERQRVALARSLAPNPRLLMLDEPLGSLDRNLRENLAQELRAILRELSLTAIYVTHDQQEALVMSDRLAIMRRGSIEQLGPPETVYRNPATEFVARFLGFRNLIPILGQTSATTLQTPLGEMPMPGKVPASAFDNQAHSQAHRQTQSTPATRYVLLIRPESARIAPASAETAGGEVAVAPSPTGQRVTVRGILHSALFFGVEYRVAMRVQTQGDADFLLWFDLPSHQMDPELGVLAPTQVPPVGAEIALHLFPDLMNLVPVDDEE